MVYIILGTGFEEIEAVATYDVLNRGGVPVCFVSVGPSPVTGAHGIRIDANFIVDIIYVDTADYIVIPGGMGGVSSIKSSRAAMEKIGSAAAAGTKLAAICAGPAVLAELGLLEGKTITCYPGCEELMTGALCDASLPVCLDGTLVTGRAPGSAIDFGLALLAEIKDKETAEKVRRDMVC